MGYAHVARGVRLDNKGRLRSEDSSKDVLGEGREVAEVITVSFTPSPRPPLPECVMVGDCGLQPLSSLGACHSMVACWAHTKTKT